MQLGFDDQKEHRLTKPLLGHIKKFNGQAVKRIREFRDFSKEVKPGDVVGADLFAPGRFRGCHRRAPKAAVSKVSSAATLSPAATRRTAPKAGTAAPAPLASACSPAPSCAACACPVTWARCAAPPRILQVIQVREADNLLLIKGAIPGSNGDYVVIRESKKRPKGWKPHAERAGEPEKARQEEVT